MRASTNGARRAAAARQAASDEAAAARLVASGAHIAQVEQAALEEAEAHNQALQRSQEEHRQ